MKRAFDVFVSGLGLLLLLPVLAVVAIVIRWQLGSPVLFRQRRPGLHGEPFLIVKFRTMTDSHDDAGRPLPDDARLTPLGRFLRSTSLDELPELWSVFKGDMSLVGPRPLLMEYLPLYNRQQARRHEVKPGVTGWAQVHGRNAVSWDRRFALDVWYVDNQSFVLDLRILFTTMWQVVQQAGISEPGEATVSRFTGSEG